MEKIKGKTNSKFSIPKIEPTGLMKSISSRVILSNSDNERKMDLDKVAHLFVSETNMVPPQVKLSDRIKEAVMPILISQTYRNVLLFLGVVSCGQYISQTYLDDERKTATIDVRSFPIFG